MSQDEINEKELVVTQKGELEETQTDNPVTESEAGWINTISYALFILIGMSIWSILGMIVGYSTQLLGISEFWKLFIYFIFYFSFLRLPFGIVHRVIQKTYDLSFPREKTFFSILMIVCFLIALNQSTIVPKFITQII